MEATISAKEPSTLCEAKPGQLFVVRTPALNECVCALASKDETRVTPPTGIVRIVVIASRVWPGEPGHRPSGQLALATRDTAITLLEQVEPVAFREFTPREDVVQGFTFTNPFVQTAPFKYPGPLPHKPGDRF